MDEAVPRTSSATVSTEREPGNVVDTAAARAVRRSPRPRARHTTVSSIDECGSTRWWLSGSRALAFRRLLGLKKWVYPGFPTPFWGLSGFCVGDSMGKPCGSSWKTAGSVFQGIGGQRSVRPRLPSVHRSPVRDATRCTLPGRGPFQHEGDVVSEQASSDCSRPVPCPRTMFDIKCCGDPNPRALYTGPVEADGPWTIYPGETRYQVLTPFGKLGTPFSTSSHKKSPLPHEKTPGPHYRLQSTRLGNPDPKKWVYPGLPKTFS